MPIEILMPGWSPQMKKANLSRWLKREGDLVRIGDVIAEVETDKAVFEVPSPGDGVLAKIVVADGTSEVQVNTVLALLTVPGERLEPTGAFIPSPRELATAAQAVSATDDLAPVPDVSSSPERSRIFASPRARRMARAARIEVASIRGSGPGGRVLEHNVLAAIEHSRRVAQVAEKSVSRLSSEVFSPRKDVAPVDMPLASWTEISHDAIRQTIARRLVESKRTIPHFYLSIDCELDALLNLKEQLNQTVNGKDRDRNQRLTVTDFIVKALAMALLRVPGANVSWTDAAMLQHRHADIGIAVSIPGGLITPIVRQAEAKTLSAISREAKELALRAKARKLEPAEYQGGSTTISNLGMFGVRSFSAIINPPQATILSIGVGEKRVIVRNDEPAVATVMSCTLSADHRAIDGALGAELLRAFKGMVEDPLSMLV
jgi:pyruvate dehydrogenase E2 component (dihydrolipoamide acetyltransferase)